MKRSRLNIVRFLATLIIATIFISSYVKSTHQHLLNKTSKTTTISTDECYLCKISSDDDGYFEDSKLNQFVFVEKLHVQKAVQLFKFNLPNQLKSRAPPLS